MGFKVKIPLGKHVKMTISSKSVGVSARTKGVRASINSKGRISTSVGNSKVSYDKTYKIGKKKKRKSLFGLLFDTSNRK